MTSIGQHPPNQAREGQCVARDDVAAALTLAAGAFERAGGRFEDGGTLALCRCGLSDGPGTPA